MALPKPSSCRTCLLFGDGTGFVPADGSGSNLVLLVFEAAGEHEAAEGKPLVGKAGFTFHRMLQRAGLKRDDFRIHNVLSCRPPGNVLRGASYEQEAVDHCAVHLDATIARMQPRVIVAGGDVALARLLPDLYQQLKKRRPAMGLLDARGYVHWSDRYRAWVIPTVHPSFIMRGQTAFESVFIRDIKRAVDVAKNGFEAEKLDHFLLDPSPAEALECVRRFEIASALDPNLHLAFDIETPVKGEDEEEIDEEVDTGMILRCGYSYGEGAHVISIPWGGMYETAHQRLLRSAAPKVAWNKSFDVGAILAQGGGIGGVVHDGMIAWHVLHSDLRKKLGFVTTFLIPGMPMWKHLSGDQPAFYNACDAFAEDVNYARIVALMKHHGLWTVYDRHVVQLDMELAKMSARGMPIDAAKREAAAVQLGGLLREVRAKMQAAVPDELKPIQPKRGYVREPTITTGLTQVVIDGVKRKRCDRCGLENPRKAHFTANTLAVPGTPGRKKTDRVGNPCKGAEVVEKLEGLERWAKRLPFVPSPKQILDYMAARKHKPIMDGRGRDRRPTTNEKALKKLIGAHPEDPLYPLVLEFRELQKVAGTYVGYVEGVVEEAVA